MEVNERAQFQYKKWLSMNRDSHHWDIAGLVVNYGISNTIVLEIP